jgi:DNA (cytosine-5)-methyltransferase 1
MEVKLLDAFAGIGGFHLGVKKACEQLGDKYSFECVGAIELNKQARKIYEQNHGETNFYPDITQLDISSLPEFNLLTGGFPCQPFSAAGLAHIRNEGKIRIEDDRSNLWAYLRAICEKKRPKYILFENVKGLKTIQNQDGSLLINTILDSLRVLGYGVKAEIYSAEQFGVPQARERLFIAGILNGEPSLPEIADNYICSKSTKDILLPKAEVNEKYCLENQWANYWLTDIHPLMRPQVGDVIKLDKGNTGKVIDIFEPNKVVIKNKDKKNEKIGSNNIDSIVYTIEQDGKKHKYALKQVLKYNKYPKKNRLEALKLDFTNRKGNGKHPTNSVNKPVLACEVDQDTPSGRSRQHDRAYHDLGISPTLTTVDSQIIYDSTNDLYRKLTPLEYSILQGFGTNFKIHENDTTAYKQFGNAVCVDVVREIVKSLIGKEK